MKKDPLLHLLTFLGALLAVAAALLLPCCMTASGNSQTGEWRTASLATDAASMDVGPEGLRAAGLNETKGFAQALDTVQTMWRNYLISAGLRYVAGRYYDLRNDEIAADTTARLEQLRNAQSVADANAALATLKATQAAEAAAAGAAAI